MKNSKIKLASGIALFAILGMTSCQKSEEPIKSPGSATSVVSSSNKNAPAVPAILEVPAGNVLHHLVYATGVQIYTCTQTSPGVYAWVFTAPQATLFANSGFNGGSVGTHYAGPTWESNSGSKVVGARLQGVSVDPAAIPWLLLGAVSSQGPGVYDGVTFIQRLNTTGGLAPATGANASTVGQQVQVPYTAEYYFYTAQ